MTTEVTTEITTDIPTGTPTEAPQCASPRQKLDYYKHLSGYLDGLATEQVFSHPTVIPTVNFTWNEIQALTGIDQAVFRNNVGLALPSNMPLTERGEVTALGAYWCCHFAWFKAQGGTNIEHKNGMKTTYRYLQPSPASSLTRSSRTEAVPVEVLSPADVGAMAGENLRQTVQSGGLKTAFLSFCRQQGAELGKQGAAEMLQAAQESLQQTLGAAYGPTPEN